MFENKTVQEIINFKWKEYTESFFFDQFRVFLFYVFSFIGSILFSTNFQFYEGSLACLLLSLVFYGRLILHEFRSCRTGSYFKDSWNWVDFILFVFYLGHFVMAVMLMIDPLTNANDEVFRIVKCAVLVVSFIKLSFYLRIYKSFCSLTTMVKDVINDIKYFLLYFFIVNIVASLCLNVLLY
jgi:hypothetical protein